MSLETFLFHYKFPLFLTSVTSFILSIFVLVNNPKNTVHRTYFGFTFCVSIWSATQALIGTWPDATAWLLIARLEHYGHVFIPSFFLHFTHALTGLRQPKRLAWSYGVSALAFCLVPTPLLVKGIDDGGLAKFVLLVGPLYPVYFLWFAGTTIESFLKLRRGVVLMAGRPQEQLKIKCVLWAMLIGYAGALPNFAYPFHINAYPLIPFSSYLIPLYPLLMSYAIVRHQALDMTIVIKKSVAYSLLVTLLTVSYFGLVYGIERIFQVTLGYHSVWLSVAAFALMALGFQPIKIGIQRAVDRLFFHAPHEELGRRMERLEQEVRQADKLKAVSILAAGMAHEIRNPLSSIKTFAEFLPERGTDPEFQRTFHRIVTDQVNRIDQIVRQLMNFAKPASTSLQPVRVTNVLDDTLNFLSSDCLKRRVQVHKIFDTDEPIQADSQQLHQVFLNLLLNSLEAMDAQGGQLAVATARNNGHLHVTIEDTGPGIPKEQLERVFEPFYTTKASGTGLGLCVVRDIMKEHRGAITIDSIPGCGTTVTLKFPLG